MSVSQVVNKGNINLSRAYDKATMLKRNWTIWKAIAQHSKYLGAKRWLSAGQKKKKKT